ncbi:putative membrane protein YgcG [Nocardioides ginsengisegetis]|uniref:Putative membrane protein YgcG n=1 Tax=Nocardioides ginsengisegetis TaxID=661491 RepID=A0A7W3J106_9ACTN|nr:DUF5130 family protein [Nocardioides sp. LS1]MBA8804308.1 putative membrane protein YgcG [Nocardioides ginsengisegetis]GCD90871.1 hypothetical protein NLS1_28770 [Nocardioides sp. LS1]
MPAGEFTSSERYTLDEAIRKAETLSRVEFSLFVGTSEGDPRAFATQLHNTLVSPTRSILIMVDPTARALEIVTGGYVRRTLSDKEVELTAAQMQSTFAEGDLVGGLTRGIAMLAEHARPQNTLHAGA